MKKSRNLLRGISILPALLVMPAMAETITERQFITESQDFANVQASVQGTSTGGALAVYMTDPTSVVNITGDSLFNGNTALPSSGYSCGGAIGLDTGVLNIDGATFTNNKATYYGAIYSKGGTMATDNTLNIKNSHFAYNEALGTGAVGLLRKGLIENTKFDHNKATEDSDGAGALFFGSVSEGVVKNSIFEYNEAAMRGGAIATRGTIGNNTDAKVDIFDSNFSHNIAGTTGGAIDNFLYNNNANEAAVNVTGSTFYDNSAVNGGAIYNHPEADLAGNYSSMKVSNSTFTSNTASENGGAIYNGGTFVLAGTNTFTGNTANGVANDIYNAGTLTFAENSTTTMDGGIAGTGDLTVANGATLNIGTADLTQDTFALNGTLVARVRDGDTAQLNVGTFSGNGTLSLLFGNPGTYHVFGDDVFAAAKDQVTSAIYDISWENSDKDIVAALKSTEEIAAANNLNTETATAVVGMSQSTSATLNDLAVAIQEKLADNTEAARQEVKQATAAINPETESVVQSVSSSVQNTVTSLASGRMSMPTVGRSGGDVKMTSGGVWAQGIFNKTKQNDAFNGYTRGIAAGMDGTINKSWTIGAGYAFAHSDVNATARDTEIDSSSVFLYGQYKPSAWYVNAVANYTMSDYSEKGVALGTGITADYDVDAFGANVATGYDFAGGITPELALRYMHVDASDYTNSLGIHNKLDSSDYLTATLGTKYAFDVKATKNLTLRPELRYAVKYDVMSDKQVATVTMPGVNSYVLDGERLSRIGGEFGIGMGVNYRGFDLSLNYDIEAREDYTSQSGRVKFRYNF